jgi:putative peptidoglycan lipid II flippase
VQQLFLLQLPAYLVSIVIVRVISTLKANVILLWGSVVSLVVNIGGNVILGGWFGVAGIALSTSLVYVASAVFLGLMLLRRLPKEGAMVPDAPQTDPAGPS